MTKYGAVDVEIRIFLTSALVGGEWPASRTSCFTPSNLCIEGWVCPKINIMHKYKSLILQSTKVFMYSVPLHIAKPGPYPSWISAITYLSMSRKMLEQMPQNGRWPYIYTPPWIFTLIPYFMRFYMTDVVKLWHVNNMHLFSTVVRFMAGLESRGYSHMDPSRWLCSTLYPQKLALTSPISGGHSVWRVHSWTQAMECSFFNFSEVHGNKSVGSYHIATIYRCWYPGNDSLHLCPW
jgi:hypothetical protein